MRKMFQQTTSDMLISYRAHEKVPPHKQQGFLIAIDHNDLSGAIYNTLLILTE